MNKSTFAILLCGAVPVAGFCLSRTLPNGHSARSILAAASGAIKRCSSLVETLKIASPAIAPNLPLPSDHSARSALLAASGAAKYCYNLLGYLKITIPVIAYLWWKRRRYPPPPPPPPHPPADLNLVPLVSPSYGLPLPLPPVYHHHPSFINTSKGSTALVSSSSRSTPEQLHDPHSDEEQDVEMEFFPEEAEEEEIVLKIELEFDHEVSLEQGHGFSRNLNLEWRSVLATGTPLGISNELQNSCTELVSQYLNDLLQCQIPQPQIGVQEILVNKVFAGMDFISFLEGALDVISSLYHEAESSVKRPETKLPGISSRFDARVFSEY